VNVGAIWGWRMLSPQWRGVWGGTMSTNLPLSYGTEGMAKAVVIMTDGKNEWSSSGPYGGYAKKAASVVRCNGGFLGYCYIPESWGTDDRLGVSLPIDREGDMPGAINAQLNNRLSQVCKNTKNAGIRIYTVAFGSPGTEIETLLRTCASLPEFFFNSPTAADLKVAFSTIGDSLSNLRVSR
jgi:hypothetical protein